MYRNMEEALTQLLENERSRREVEDLIKIVRQCQAEQYILRLAGAILQAPGAIKISQ